MSFTYSPDLTIPLNYLRFRIDDKEEDFAEYQDEELNYFLNKIPGTPTEHDIDKVALRLLKQQLQEILRGPSRERSGAFETYQATAEALKLAVKELEDEIRSSIGNPSPSFGGVYANTVTRNRSNKAYVDTKFYDGRVYRDKLKDPSFFPED